MNELIMLIQQNAWNRGCKKHDVNKAKQVTPFIKCKQVGSLYLFYSHFDAAPFNIIKFKAAIAKVLRRMQSHCWMMSMELSHHKN